MQTTTVPDCWAATLDTVHARIALRFRRADARTRGRRYLGALLAPVERKNGWQLAEHLSESGPQGVQRLLNAAHGDATAVRDDPIAFVAEQLGDPDSVLIVDETGFLKKGTKSVGEQQRCCGRDSHRCCHLAKAGADADPARIARSSLGCCG